MATVYCGIDFHKRTSTICSKKLDGELVERVTVRTSNLVNYLSNRKEYLIGIEASGGTNDMVQRLKDHGHDVRILNTNRCNAIGIGGQKTDPKDANAISDILRVNYIPEVYHKSLRARRLKSLIVGREMIVRSRVNLTNHIRGTLREYGIVMPQGREEFFKHCVKSIESVDCCEIKEHLLYLFEKSREFLAREHEMELQLKKLCSEDERVKRLTTIPGVKTMTAAAFIAVTDDHTRFEDSRKFASYLGLVPREYSSGDKRRMGSITRSGSEILRRYLIHGARTVLMHTKDNHDDPNRRWALRVKKRAGMNKATVALAHRMARTCYAVVSNGTEYRHVPKKALAS